MIPLDSWTGYNPDAGPDQYGKPADIVRVKQLELQRHQREYNDRERQLQQLRENIRQDLLKERSKIQNGTTAAVQPNQSGQAPQQSSAAVNKGEQSPASLGAVVGLNSGEPAIYAGYKHSEEMLSVPAGSPPKPDGLKGGKLVSSLGYSGYGDNDIVQGLYSDQNKNTRHR